MRTSSLPPHKIPLEYSKWSQAIMLTTKTTTTTTTTTRWRNEMRHIYTLYRNEFKADVIEKNGKEELFNTLSR
jgi:hypothetical protein